MRTQTTAGKMWFGTAECMDFCVAGMRLEDGLSIRSRAPAGHDAPAGPVPTAPNEHAYEMAAALRERFGERLRGADMYIKPELLETDGCTSGYTIYAKEKNGGCIVFVTNCRVYSILAKHYDANGHFTIEEA